MRKAGQMTIEKTQSRLFGASYLTNKPVIWLLHSKFRWNRQQRTVSTFTAASESLIFRLHNRCINIFGVILVCLALILRPSSMKVLSLITFIIRVFLHWSYCSPCSSRAQKCIIVTNRHHLEKWGRPKSEEIFEISEIFEFSIKSY